MRILIVEDDELVADALKRGLGAAGFAVDRVGSAEQAEAAFATRSSTSRSSTSACRRPTG